MAKKKIVGHLPTIKDPAMLAGQVEQGQIFKGPENQLYMLVGQQEVGGGLDRAQGALAGRNSLIDQVSRIDQEQAAPALDFMTMAKNAGFMLKPFDLPRGVGKGTDEETMNKHILLKFLRGQK